MEEVSYEMIVGEELIWRWKKTETLGAMKQLAQEAEDAIGLFGVTAFAEKPPFEVKVCYAKVTELVEAGFLVYITPLNFTPEHRTVVFPKPLTEEIMNKWFTIWQKGC